MSKQSILITGATSGIGFEAAKDYLQKGWQVVFTGRDHDRIATAERILSEFAQSPSHLVGVLCDNSEFNHFPALVAQLSDRGIYLDALILNAGVFYPSLFNDSNLNDINATMSINFTGPALLLQALRVRFKAQCSVVYVSSIAVQRAFQTASVYAASKAAFEALATTLNLEWAADGIRINFLRPGVTDTEIQGKAGMSNEQIDGLRGALATTPLGRMLTPNELISSLAFLTSAESSALRGIIGTEH